MNIDKTVLKIDMGDYIVSDPSLRSLIRERASIRFRFGHTLSKDFNKPENIFNDDDNPEGINPFSKRY